MTFQELCDEEAKLKSLYEQVKMTRIGRGESVNSVWYNTVKPQMKFLVGMLAENPKMRSNEAWDVSYETLYSLLSSRKGRREEGK